MGLEQVGKFLMKAAAQKYSVNQQRKAQKASAAQSRVQRQNVLVNKQSNNDPVYVMYGKQRMGGTRVYVDTSDGAGDLSKTNKLNMVVVLCEGAIDRPEKVYFNDTVVWDIDDTGVKTYNGDGGYELTGFISKYASTITMNWFPGSAPSAAPGSPSGPPDYIPGWYNGRPQRMDTALQDSIGVGAWTSEYKLQGVCYFTILLEASSEDYAGQLPTVTVEQCSKKMLDLDDLTEGQTTTILGDYVNDNGNQNPADVLYDYLISGIYGKGLDRDENGDWVCGLHIVLDSFQQAKSDCDAARSGAGYMVDGYLQTERQLFDNVGEILETCNGMLLFIDGKYHLKIQKKNEQTGLGDERIFTKDNMIGEILLSLPTKSTKLNKITATFSNPATKYNDDVIIHDNATYRVEDNGSVLETTADYTMITNSALVTDLITQTVNKSRNEQTISFVAAHTALLLRSGDIIEVRHDEFGWGTGAGETQKFWRVQELKLTEDNTVEVSAITYDSAQEL